MLTAKKFLFVCHEAYLHAQYFLSARHGPTITPKTFFEDPTRAVQALEDFVSNATGITVVPATLKNQFASWLIADRAGSMSIAIDQTQLISWQHSTGKPIPNQRILSLIHEFAHTQITPRLTKGVTASAYPMEEERAWIYTYVFLSVICGDYSFNARTTSNIDDVPRYII